MNDVTQILQAIERGDAKAANELLPFVYDELRWKRRLKMDPLGVTDVTWRGLRVAAPLENPKDVCNYGTVE